MSAVIIKNALIRLNLTATPELPDQLTDHDFNVYSGMLNYYANIDSTTAALSIENLDVLPDIVIAMLQNEEVTEINLDMVTSAVTGKIDVMSAFVSPGAPAYQDLIQSIQDGTQPTDVPKIDIPVDNGQDSVSPSEPVITPEPSDTLPGNDTVTGSADTGTNDSIAANPDQGQDTVVANDTVSGAGTTNNDTITGSDTIIAKPTENTPNDGSDTVQGNDTVTASDSASTGNDTVVANPEPSAPVTTTPETPVVTPTPDQTPSQDTPSSTPDVQSQPAQ